MQKRLTVIGTTFNSRTAAAKAEIMSAVEREMLPRLQNRRVVAPTIQVHSVLNVKRAYEQFKEGTGGKVVLNFKTIEPTG